MRLRVSSAKDCVFRGAWRLSRLQPPQLASVPPATQTSRAPLVPHRLLGRGTSCRKYAQETPLGSWPLRVMPDASLRNRALAVMPVIEPQGKSLRFDANSRAAHAMKLSKPNKRGFDHAIPSVGQNHRSSLRSRALQRRRFGWLSCVDCPLRLVAPVLGKLLQNIIQDDADRPLDGSRIVVWSEFVCGLG